MVSVLDYFPRWYSFILIHDMIIVTLEMRQAQAPQVTLNNVIRSLRSAVLQALFGVVKARPTSL